MSAFGDLLELMHGASTRFGSLHATIVERQHGELMERAFKRFGEQVGMAAGGGYFMVPRGEAGPDGEPADEHVTRIELWAEPGRYREVRTMPDFESVRVADGARWWDWSEALGLQSSDEQRGVTYSSSLDEIDPAWFLAGYTLEPAGTGTGTVAGRDATCVRVHSTRVEPRPAGLGPGIEDALLWLDAEHGIVLRRAELVDGEEAFVREVETIVFDEPLPPGTFVFELPEGASPKALAVPEMITVDAAAERASFTVWKLASVPPGWRVHAIYVAALERPVEPDSLVLVYMRTDGGERLQIQQRTTEHELPAIGGERRFERSGRSYIALGPEQPEGREAAELIFALDGTQLRLSSSEQSLERLLDHAEQLVPA